MKFDFLGYFASFLTFLEHLDGGEACKIQNKLKFGWKNEIWNIQAYLAFLAKIAKFFKMRIYHPKYIFLPAWQVYGLKIHLLVVVDLVHAAEAMS